MTESRPQLWVDMEQRYTKSPIHATLGLTLEVVDAENVLIHYDGTPGGSNTLGFPSGGLLAQMVDSAVMQSVITRLGEGDKTTTLELKINYLRSAGSGEKLTAHGSLEFVGRTTSVGVARVKDSSGKVIAVGTVTASIRRKA